MAKHGADFYREIGAKGQATLRKRHAGKAKEWGKLGGRPRKAVLIDMGEAAQKERMDGDPPSPLTSPTAAPLDKNSAS